MGKRVKASIFKSVVCLHFFVLVPLCAASAVQRSSFEIGPSLSRITYKEPGYMQNTGVLHGVSVAYSMRGDAFGLFDMFRTEADAAWGSVDYTSLRTGTMQGVPDSKFETRVMFGQNLLDNGSVVIAQYLGFGYRRLTDNSYGMTSTTGDAGYDRQSNYYYSPIGVQISSSFKDGWSLDGSVEYDYFWYGTQVNSHYTPLPTFTNHQSGGYGLRASVKVTKKIGSASLLSFEPFFRYWNINNSDLAREKETSALVVNGSSGIIEPANNSKEYGLKIGLEF